MKFSRVEILASQYREEMVRSFKDALDRSDFINGENVGILEDELSSVSGFSNTVTVASGTDALYVAISSLGLPMGSEVITTAFSFVSTAESICRAGCTPVFADTNADDFNISLDSIKEVFSDRVKAVVAVELFGNPISCDLIEYCAQNNVHLVVDAAQSFRFNMAGCNHSVHKKKKNVLRCQLDVYLDHQFLSYKDTWCPWRRGSCLL